MCCLPCVTHVISMSTPSSRFSVALSITLPTHHPHLPALCVWYFPINSGTFFKPSMGNSGEGLFPKMVQFKTCNYWSLTFSVNRFCVNCTTALLVDTLGKTSLSWSANCNEDFTGLAQSLMPCNTSSTCATQKTSPPHQRAPLNTVHSGSPMQVVAVDILHPLSASRSDNRYALVMMDYFTH